MSSPPICCQILCPLTTPMDDIRKHHGPSRTLRLDDRRPGIRLMNYQPKISTDSLGSQTREVLAVKLKPEEQFQRVVAKVKSLDRLKPKRKPGVEVKEIGTSPIRKVVVEIRQQGISQRTSELRSESVKLHSSKTSYLLVRDDSEQREQTIKLRNIMAKQDRKEELLNQKRELLIQQSKIRARLRNINSILGPNRTFSSNSLQVKEEVAMTAKRQVSQHRRLTLQRK